MNETTSGYIGLDIHNDANAMAMAEVGRSTLRLISTMPPEPAALRKALMRSPKRSNTVIVFEVGLCGNGWPHYLSAQRWRCEAISSPHITNRLDAQLHARESRTGRIVSVVVPDERDYAIRDLARA